MNEKIRGDARSLYDQLTAASKSRDDAKSRGKTSGMTCVIAYCMFMCCSHLRRLQE